MTTPRRSSASPRAVDVVTIEFENLPVAAARAARRARCRCDPAPAVLAICQDRLREKAFLDRIGVADGALARGRTMRPSWRAALAEPGRPLRPQDRPLRLRRQGPAGAGAGRRPGRRLGALGRRRRRRRGAGRLRARDLGDHGARRRTARQVSYPPVENQHREHILAQHHRAGADRAGAGRRGGAASPSGSRARSRSSACSRSRCSSPATGGCWSTSWRRGRTTPGTGRSTPARSASSSSWCARSAGCRSATPAGSPMRSWTICSAPAVAAWPELLAEPGARLHLYGKREIRPGRKLGHVTRLTRRDRLKVEDPQTSVRIWLYDTGELRHIRPALDCLGRGHGCASRQFIADGARDEDPRPGTARSAARFGSKARAVGRRDATLLTTSGGRGEPAGSAGAGAHAQAYARRSAS